MKLKSLEEYVEKAKQLGSEEIDYLLARMRARLERLTDQREPSITEVLATQLKYEDEALTQWRERLAEIKAAQEGGEIAAETGG